MEDLRSGNDNLKEWRTKRTDLTERLMQRSLEKLISLKAVLNQKNICEMMERIASEEDKEYKAVISPSAISKNRIYKNMYLQAKEKVKLTDNKKQKYKIDGDKQLEIFRLRTLLAKKEVRVQELESSIDRANIPIYNNQEFKLEKEEEMMKKLLYEMIQLSLNSVFIYKDKRGNLVDEYSNEIIITKEIYEMLGK